MNAVRGLETDDAVFQSEQSKVTPLPDEFAGKIHGTLLADKDTAGRDRLTAESFDAAPLGIRIATVLGTAAPFFSRHFLLA